MSRCFAFVLSFAALFAAPLPAAQPYQPDPLVLSFAVCAGRFAAMTNAQTGNLRDMRATYSQFAELLGTIGPLPDDRSPSARHIRAVRAQARAETAQLIDIFTYGRDPRRSRLAKSMISQRIQACDSLLG